MISETFVRTGDDAGEEADAPRPKKVANPAGKPLRSARGPPKPKSAYSAYAASQREQYKKAKPEQESAQVTAVSPTHTAEACFIFKRPVAWMQSKTYAAAAVGTGAQSPVGGAGGRREAAVRTTPLKNGGNLC